MSATLTTTDGDLGAMMDEGITFLDALTRGRGAHIITMHISLSFSGDGYITVYHAPMLDLTEFSKSSIKDLIFKVPDGTMQRTLEYIRMIRSGVQIEPIFFNHIAAVPVVHEMFAAMEAHGWQVGIRSLTSDFNDLRYDCLASVQFEMTVGVQRQGLNRGNGGTSS